MCKTKLMLELELVQLKLDLILERQQLLLHAVRKEMAKIDDLIKDVQDETTLIDGIGTFVQGLKDQLTASGIDQAKLDAAFAAVEANKAKLAAALAANVPPAPVPAPTP